VGLQVVDLKNAKKKDLTLVVVIVSLLASHEEGTMAARLIAFILSFLLVLAFTACKGNNTTSPVQGNNTTSPVPGAPAAPTSLSAITKAQNVTLQWSAVDAATSYNIYYSTTSSPTKTTGIKIQDVTLPYTHTHLSAGSYYYVVTAASQAGESSESTEVTAKVNRVAFVTSTSGNGNLGSWADAGGKSGLAAADAICQNRASAAGLTGDFTAWISDTSNDAYCRVHNLAGKKTSNCGQPTLPVAAGPWVRTDGYPYSGIISELTSSGEVYAPARYDEYGILTPGSTFYFTNTLFSGKADLPGGSSCGEWTTTNASDYAGAGSSDVTAGLMYHAPCSNSALRLLCMQTGDGPVLPDFATTGKKVFVSSSMGTGNLGSWFNAGGNTGIAAGDKVCQSLAANAGLANAANFKAWLSDSSTNAIDRITSNGSNGPWVRLDGVKIADSKNDLTDGSLFTSISLDDTGTYYRELLDFYTVWTGTLFNGTKNANNSCNNWTDGTASYTTAAFGHDVKAGAEWTGGFGTSCNLNNFRIYCFED